MRRGIEHARPAEPEAIPRVRAVAETLRLSSADGEPSCMAMTFDLDVAHPALA